MSFLGKIFSFFSSDKDSDKSKKIASNEAVKKENTGKVQDAACCSDAPASKDSKASVAAEKCSETAIGKNPGSAAEKSSKPTKKEEKSKMAKIYEMRVGESLKGDGNEVAHID
ncbi:MAG: hypothetical protein ACU833_08280, partial [Gammaproteobacteria bacterium]